MIKQFGYCSIAVRNMQEGIDLYTSMFGLQVMQPPGNASQYGFRACRLGNGEDPFIELLEPTEENAAIARFLRSRGEGVYLVSLQVNDLKQAVRQVRSAGGIVTGLGHEEEPGPDTKVVWVHPSSTKGVFIELSTRP